LEIGWKHKGVVIYFTLILKDQRGAKFKKRG